MHVYIGIDTVLKVWEDTPARGARNIIFSLPEKISVVPHIRGIAGVYHGGKTDIVKITRSFKRHCSPGDQLIFTISVSQYFLRVGYV